MPNASHSPTGSTRWLLVLPLLTAACTTTAPVPRPTPPAAIARGEAPIAPAPTPTGLYAADEALRDVLAGELEFAGTGRWPGIERSHACAFRNERVLVVLAYCTITEVSAFRVDVYSPERGRMRVYAETRGPLSQSSRSDYFTFMVESEPPPDPATGIGPLLRTMSYAQLQQYEQLRHDARLPGCYGGEQIEAPVGRCFDALADRYGEWTKRNRAFLEHANDDWYRVVRMLHALAERHGMDPD